MIAACLVVAAAIYVAVWLWIAFRPSHRTADRVRYFTKQSEAADYVIQAENDGFDCFGSTDEAGVIQIRCYRRKERNS